MGEPGVEIKLTVPQLSGVEISGAGDATVNSLTSADFDSTLSGSCRLPLEHPVARSLRADVRGSGDLVVSGTVASHDIRLSGSGNCEARDLAGATVRADVVSGSGL